MNLKYAVIWVLPSQRWVEVSFEVTHLGLENAIEFANERKENVYLVKRLPTGKKDVEVVWSYDLQNLEVSAS